MRTLTEPQFAAVQQAIAGSHLLYQRLIPALKKMRAGLDKETRKLELAAVEAIRTGYAVIAELSADDATAPADMSNLPAQPIADIDPKVFRNELENVSALNLPDLEHEMTCALLELPAYTEAFDTPENMVPKVAKLLAWAWEAGRRYAFIEALAVFTAVTEEFTEGTKLILEAARDRSLDLPAPETESADTAETIDPAKPKGPQRVM